MFVFNRELKYFDALVEDITIPATDTTYWNKVIKLSEKQGKLSLLISHLQITLWNHF
jgi:hypothetical protein